MGAQFALLAEEAAQYNYSHLHYLEALLQTAAPSLADMAAEINPLRRENDRLRMETRDIKKVTIFG